MRTSMLSIPALLGAVLAGATVVANGAGADPASHSACASPEQELIKAESGTQGAPAGISPATPDAPATGARGQIHALPSGGRWIRDELEVEPAYASHGTAGWDPRRQRHVGIWVDGNTGRIRDEGRRGDAAKRTLTGESEPRQPDPRVPGKLKRVEGLRGDSRLMAMTAIRPTVGKAVAYARIAFPRRGAPPSGAADGAS